MNKIFKEILFILTVGLFYFINLFLIIFSQKNYGFGNTLLALMGLIIGFFGLLLWIIGFFSLGKAFNIFPKPIKYINTGIYKFIHHPIYLGISLTFVGFSICVGSFWGLFFSIFILSPFNLIRSKLEAKQLKKHIIN